MYGDPIKHPLENGSYFGRWCIEAAVVAKVFRIDDTEEYSRIDADVEDFRNWFMPWYLRIQRRQIRLPCYEYQLSNYFVNPDLSPLAERYTWGQPSNRLSDADARFTEAIRDWLSDPMYLKRLKAAGEDPSAILDEHPPPEEEV